MRFYPLLLAICVLLSCNNREGSFTGDLESPQVQFVIEKITESVSSSSGSQGSFREFCFSLEEGGVKGGDLPGSYSILNDAGRITISSGDVNGLMYGGLEVAEQIRLYGMVKDTQHSPYITRRGIKMNIPLDARTPGYDDTGDAAQNNIGTVWEWDFWKEYLDQLAIHRYNVLTLWNPHPFPSMIKQDNYPDVALDDVCATTLKPTSRESEWAEPQMVSRNVVENLRTIKEIGIDDKIAFWQKVMQYAHDRGIDIYYFTWNICPNGAARPVEPFYRTYGIELWDEEPGKHGITYQMDNPVTLQYFRDAVKIFLQTYPHVKGIGVTAGEHMMDSAGPYSREQWIWESYGLGMLDAREADPDREVDFIHRVWNTDMDKIMHYWEDYPGSFEASFKYARARLYSIAEPDFAEGHIESMKKYGLKSWWNLRNDDIFVHRWGDPDYVRDFINYFDLDHTEGFYMGSDGYFWGREFNSKVPELSGELEINKHWYRFMMWGRLAYDPSLDKDFFIARLRHHYPETDADLLYRGLQTASKIIPLVNRFHWNDWDYQWSVEACIDQRNGFHDIRRFMTNPTLPKSGMLNPVNYAGTVAGERPEGKPGDVEGLTPYEVSAELAGLAEKTGRMAEELISPENSAELGALLDDMQSTAYLGMYYSTRIEAATELALYKVTGEKTYKEKAVSVLKRSAEHWKSYSEIMNENYRPQMLARTRYFDTEVILKEVLKDIETANNYKN